MILTKTLPLYLLFLLLGISTVLADGVFSRTLRRAHGTAVKHTRTIAKDLRIAFGGVLVAQSPLDSAKTRVIYCKSNSGTLTGGDSSGDDGTGSGTSSGTGTSSNGTSTRTGSGTSTATSGSPSASASAVSTPWNLVKEHSGQSFFSGWDFWTFPDPTNGVVDYISESEGRSAGLVEVDSDGYAIMRVETTQTVSNLRKSIRIHSKDSYNHFLMIMDAVHMPTGCGTWPAFWTNGPNWPAGGEIDIVEGVHDYTHNQAALHTSPGCRIDGSRDRLGISGTVLGTNCAAEETSNEGCGIRSSSDKSFGAPFNRNGGGVYATTWTDDGISVYFFERDDIPSDITAGTPLPSLWGRPQANWPASGCDPDTFFHDNIAIFDTTFCGDWAKNVWTSSGIPGQEQSCAARTGVADCESYVRSRGSAFTEAYWRVKYVKIYQTD